MQDNVTSRVREIVQPNTTSFNLQMEEQVKKVNMLAEYIGQTGHFDDDDLLELLRAAVRNNGLLRCAFAYPDGSFVTHDGKNQGNVSDEAFFKSNMQGQFFITDPKPAIVDASKTVMLFSCPVFQNGRVVGSLVYSYLCNDLDKIFNLSFLDSQGQLLVVKHSGETLIGKSSLLEGTDSNLIAYLRGQCTHEMHDPKDCISLDRASGSCVVSFADGRDALLINFDRLNYNDWYILSTVPQRAAAKFVSNITSDQRRLGVTIAICALIYLSAILGLWLSQRSNTDKMTGALTTEGFKRAAKKLLRRHAGQAHVLVKFDVKNLKIINRVYSHSEGDRVIKNIVTALHKALEGQPALYARVGPDDFVLITPYYNPTFLLSQRAEFIEAFIALMGEQFTATVEFPSGQYIISPEECAHPDVTDALEKANFAHRKAKESSMTIIVDYMETLERAAILQKSIEDQMAPALADGEFALYLQPKYSLPEETICGAEALIRWEKDGKIFKYPSEFIPIFESNGFIVKIDFWMFEQASMLMRRWIDEGRVVVPVSVNFSRHHLFSESFVSELCAIADRHHIPRHLLEIELTESTIFDNIDRISLLTEELHAEGFTLSMDDFGSGYSSLGLLKDLAFDALKIDKCFFDECEFPDRAHIVVANVLTMAQQLGIQTVAEGIETREQVDLLEKLGCNIIQGYYFSRPVPGNTLRLPLKSGEPVKV